MAALFGENTRAYGDTGSEQYKMTEEQLRKFMPKGSRAKVTDKILDILNNVEDDGIDQKHMREKVTSYMDVLKEGKYSIEEYLNAVKYNIAVLNGMTNKQAYAMVKPERIVEIEAKAAQRAKEIERGSHKAPIDLDNYVSMYNSGDLVVEIKSRMMLDVAIMNQPVNAEALNIQVNLMRGISALDPEGRPQRVTPLIQLQAAQSVFTNTQLPRDNTIQLKVGYDEQALEVQQNIAEQIKLAAQAQMERFKGGEKLDSVQQLNIEYAEAEVVEE